MGVVPIRKTVAPARKTIAANQKAVDEVPLLSGTWNVEGVPGLYLRCRAKTKSFFLQRRVDGHLVKENLGPLPMKRARAAAMKKWTNMKPPEPAADGVLTLGAAIDQYLAAKALAPKTLAIAKYNKKTYLPHWENRSLEDIGRDRAGVRLLQQRLTKEHRPATSNQVIRLLSAVYRWHRKVNTDLPESPMVVAEIHHIKARDWAYSDDELGAWWSAPKKDENGDVVKKDGKVVMQGVSTLGAIKRMWWLTALFTGARKGSIEALKWTDLDLSKKTIHFRVTKGDRPYIIPVADKLAELLTAYRTSDDVPPSEWVFPSPVIDGAHLIDVKNPVEGVGPAHRLRHTYRTTLAQIGATPDQARMLMGHSMGNDVSRGYISSALVVESLRPVTNAVAAHHVKILGLAV
jgi:integrase